MSSDYEGPEPRDSAECPYCHNTFYAPPLHDPLKKHVDYCESGPDAWLDAIEQRLTSAQQELYYAVCSLATQGRTREDVLMSYVSGPYRADVRDITAVRDFLKDYPQ